MIWNKNNIRRIILDMAAQIQKTPVSAVAGLVTSPIDLYRDLGMDSLSRMLLAAQVNEFFGIFQTGIENYLLADSILDHWIQKTLRAREEYDRDVVFLTSGTSGTPKQVRHLMSSLLLEARVLQKLLPRPTQIFSTVPANHIYGFLYTVMLPALWEIPLFTLSSINAATLTTESLIIGTPFTWDYVYRTRASSGAMPCYGVSSTAPLSPILYSNLQKAGVDLFDIYGSSDTGGLAFRRSPDAPFQLLPHVSMVENSVSAVTIGDNLHPLPDQIERISERKIRVLGRIDGAIQIAGVNIYPAHIQKIVDSCPLIAESDLYHKAMEGQLQLFCSIRLLHRTEHTEKACLNWLKENLRSPELPVNIHFY